jgi:transcriptional regulator with XRE-family HTH domain
MLLHEEIRRAREDMGWTQAHLAVLAGIPRNQVVRTERGDNITLDTLRKIAVHLPVENLTLLEKVHLNLDVLPLPEKVYSYSVHSLMFLTKAMGMALEAALASREAMEKARETAPIPGLETLGVDDLLALRAMAGAFNELQTKMEESRSD